MDWSDPESRLRLIERVGATEYNRQHDAHRKASTVATVNGHDIRPIGSAFGRLFMVGDTGTAFQTLPEAEAFARKQPPKTPPAPKACTHTDQTLVVTRFITGKGHCEVYRCDACGITLPPTPWKAD